MSAQGTPTWRDKAACLGQDPEQWFPLPSQNGQAAKAICRDCPVRYECGADAIRNHDRHGIRAAYSLPNQARSLRRYVELTESERIAAALTEPEPAEVAPEPTRVCTTCGNEFPTTQKNRRTCWPCGRGPATPAATVAEHVRALQAAHGWSLSEIGRRAGIDPATVSRIARGALDTVLVRTAEQLLAVGVEAEAVTA